VQQCTKAEQETAGKAEKGRTNRKGRQGMKGRQQWRRHRGLGAAAPTDERFNNHGAILTSNL